jgi:hypothetical protein
MLNGASVVGRVVPNIFVERFGVFNVVVPCVAACAILIFSTLAVKSVAATLVFTVLYGFFSGACMPAMPYPVCLVYANGRGRVDVGLFAPMVASLAKDDDEIGARLGICFTFTGKSNLPSCTLQH